MEEQRASRKYMVLDPAKAHPVGRNLFYECTACGTAIPSVPSQSTRCKCNNIRIDIDYGRICIADYSKARLFSEE